LFQEAAAAPTPIARKEKEEKKQEKRKRVSEIKDNHTVKRRTTANLMIPEKILKPEMDHFSGVTEQTILFEKNTYCGENKRG